LASVYYTVEGVGAGLLDGGKRSRVYWVGRGVYMDFRTTVLGIHVYVYIGYVVIDTQ